MTQQTNQLEIIAIPDRKRNDSRGMTREEAQKFVEAMNKAGEGNAVKVPESSTKEYEKSYAKGERVRTAIKKFKLTEKTVTVRAFKPDEKKDEFVAVVAFKD